MAGGGADRPTATEEIDLVVGIDAAGQMERQMQIQEAGVGPGAHDGAFFFLSLGASIIRGETGRAADGAILTGQFVGEQFLCGSVIGDFLVGQEGDEAFLEGAKAAFDFSFGLWAGRDQMSDAQGGKSALELRAGIAVVTGGLMAEEGQAISVERHWQAVEGEGPAEMLEVVPGGIGGNEDRGQEFAGVVIDGQQEGLFIIGRPPLVDG